MWVMPTGKANPKGAILAEGLLREILEMINHIGYIILVALIKCINETSKGALTEKSNGIIEEVL
jgi:hypothetical protein